MSITSEALRSLVGKVVCGKYPRHNYQGIPKHLEDRCFRVDRVRVMTEEPLEPETSALNPLLQRGTILVTGWDFGRQAERSFYWESLADVQIDSDESRAESTVPDPHVSFIVPRPADWAPSSPTDLPPDFERHLSQTKPGAEAFVKRFNTLEINEPVGFWAV